jgi:hypothetical protein
MKDEMTVSQLLWIIAYYGSMIGVAWLVLYLLGVRF